MKKHEHEKIIECMYCSQEMKESECLGDGEQVPGPGADEFWEAQARIHHEGCEWVETRAHRC